MPATLTQKAVESAKAEATRREIPDALVPGLRLVVQPSGAKSWAVRYRHLGAPKKLVLGPLAPVIDDAEPTPTLGHPLTLRGAREIAREQLRVLATGRDPAQEKQAAKKVAQVPEVRDRDLVRTVAAQFLDKHVRPNNKPGYAKTVEYILNKDVLPRWGERRIQELRRRDVLDLLDSVVERGAATQANRVLACVRKLLNWAVSRDILDDSPARGVKPPTKEQSRDRVLTDAELRLVWLAAGQLGHPWGAFVRTLILTGARRDEAAGLRRSELTDGGALWVLPKARTKNKREHRLPLSAQAHTVLAGVPAVKAGKDEPSHKGLRDLMFTTTGHSPPSGFARAKTTLDAAVLRLAKREAEERGDDPDEIAAPPAWTFHDLRRTLVSGMAKLGIGLPVIERAVNHVSESFGGVRGVYQKHSFEDEMRVAFETWGRHVEAVASGSPSNVVPLVKKPRRPK